MNVLFHDFLIYLKAMLKQGWNWVFLLVGIIGTVVYFLPSSAETTQKFSIIVMIIAFVLANFSAFRSHSRQLRSELQSLQDNVSDLRLREAHIRLSVDSTPSLHVDRRVRSEFDEQGLPSGAAIWVALRIENIGEEAGSLEWGIDQTASKLPPLFFFDSYSRGYFDPAVGRVNGRDKRHAYYYLPIKTHKQGPKSFAASLNSLTTYCIVIAYTTNRVGQLAETGTIQLEGGFQEFREEVLRHWKEYGFSDLVQIAESP